MNASKRTSDNVVLLVPERPLVNTSAGGLVDTDIANAQRLARRYGRDIRYTIEAGWLVWSGCRWCNDERDVRIQAFAKDTALGIFDESRMPQTAMQ